MNILLKNIFRDVIVKLKKQNFSHCIIVVLRGIVNDMGLSTRVTVLFVSVGRGDDSLITFDKFPPGFIVLIWREIFSVEGFLKMSHRSRRPGKYDNML
jgi:hypothetical protein